MDAELKLKCNSCGNRFRVMTMKYDKTGKNLICEDCYARQNPQTARPAPTVKPAEQKEVDKWYCKKCGYKFSRKKGAVVSRCPYCNNAMVAKQEDLHAASLVDQSSDGRFDF
ncbi:hypothetical protein C4573_03830 [Candidatus Woesearchaeota archaeon]|nr:MAG: hypothetical protein C4573_03830 [Candidatus Woesearchaeota archaeon]